MRSQPGWARVAIKQLHFLFGMTSKWRQANDDALFYGRKAFCAYD